MVRVWLRPCASALAAFSRVGPRATVLRAQVLCAQSVGPLIGNVRALSVKSKDEDKKEFKKKSTFDKVVEDEHLTEVPDEVKYLSQQLDEKDFAFMEEIEEEEEEEEDEELSPAEWAKKFEREVAEWDQDEGKYQGEDGEFTELPKEADDRLYVEMPGYDSSMGLAGSQIGVSEDANRPDPFEHWDQGMAITPEMLNWMLPAEKRKPFKKEKVKPWKYFVAANHQDVVELALDVELLRLFISPTGRIRPRRFTGLTAKQQRKLAQAIKVSRQLALLPFLSRYPEPTPEQWKAIDEEIIAAAELEDDNDDVVDDDEGDEFDEDFEYD